MKKHETHIPKPLSVFVFILALLGASSVWAAPGDLLWKHETGGAVNSSPALGADGTIYAGCEDGKLYAINPDGTPKWNYAAGGGIFSSPAVAADGTVYVGSTDKRLHAVNPDGTQKWAHITGDEIYSSPAIAGGGIIYVGSRDDYLYAINPTGSLLKRHLTGSNVDSSPAIGNDGTVYVGSWDKNLHAFRSDGSSKWPPYSTGAAISFSSPAMGPDGTVYVGSGDKSLYAVASDGSLKWTYPTGGAIESSPAIASDGTVYVGSWDHHLYAITPEGTLKWKYRACDDSCDSSDGVFSSPAVGVSETVYVGSTDGTVYAVAFDGDLKWRSQSLGGAVRSSPAMGRDGTVYVGGADGLYALEGDMAWPYETYAAPAPQYAASHWPKFGQNHLNISRKPAFELALPHVQVGQEETVSATLTLDNFQREAIRLVDITLSFDPNLVEITEITAEGGMLENGYGLSQHIDNQAGRATLGFVASGTDAHVEDGGAIAYVGVRGKMDAEGTGGLNFSEAQINAIHIGAKHGSTDLVPRYGISGTVTYQGDRGPVSGVNLALSDDGGDTQPPVTTDGLGDYAFSGIPAGNYTLEPSKSGDRRGLSALDASRILQYVSGNLAFDCLRIIAGDANHDNGVGEDDAVAVALCSGKSDLGLECETGPDWVFVSEAVESCDEWPPISFSATGTFALDSNRTDQDFTAILVGDVSQNWPDAKRVSGKRGLLSASVRSDVDMQVFSGDPLMLPVVLETSSETGIEGIDILIRFDGDVIGLASATLMGGPLAAWEPHLQVIRGEDAAAVKIYGSEEIRMSQSGIIAFLHFDTIGSGDSISEISLGRFDQNETPASGGLALGEIAASKVNLTVRAYEKGDIDHNGKVELRDALLALIACAGGKSENIHPESDTDGDGKIGIADAVGILQRLVREIGGR